jgi:glycosyltransferase involved in cell wall biosynthesis
MSASSPRALFQSFDPLVSKAVRHGVRRLRGPFGSSVYYVVGQGKWAFYWEATGVAAALRASGRQARVVVEPGGLRNQVVHFIDRYSYLDGTFRTMHPSNRVFLTWLHEFLPDVDAAEAGRLQSALLEALPELDRIVASCTAGRRGLLELGVPEEKIALIPLGVDLATFAPPQDDGEREAVRRALGIPPDAFCIGSFQKDGVGWGEGLEPKLIKGPDTFLQTIERLSERVAPLFVLLTGPARGYVKHGLDRLEIEHAHHLLNDYRALGRYYRALDAYLATGRSEGGPKAFLESWASGVPVVSTEVGMPADLVVHGENGMLGEPGDAEALAAGLQRFAEDPELHSHCIRNALKQVKAYGYGAIAERYSMELYAPVLDA